MSQPAGSTPVLSYAAKPRRRWRRYVLGFALLLIASVGVYWRTVIGDRITHLYWQHRVETSERTQGVLVCQAYCWRKERTPKGWQSVKELTQNSNYCQIFLDYQGSDFGGGRDGAALIMPEVSNYISGKGIKQVSIDDTFARGGLLFAGLRRSRSGNTRIVFVAAYLPLFGRGVSVVYQTIIPATLFKSEVFPSYLGLNVPNISIRGENGFRAFGGQRDPADPSRFTIDYETATEKGTIVGVLQDDGSVVFSIVKR